MSFFGLFKSKQEKEMGKIQSKMYSNIFPGGHEQSDKEVREVYELLGSKYSKNQVAKSYIHMAGLFFVAEDKSEERIVGSAMIRADGEIAKEDILKIYTYIKNKFLKQQLGAKDEDGLDEISKGVFGGDEGCDTDEIPGGHGDYGYSSTNPIPTKGVMGSNAYLSRLRPVNSDVETKWERTGSCSADNIENMIDEDKLSNTPADQVVNIYISPYHRRNSKKAPKGFELS